MEMPVVKSFQQAHGIETELDPRGGSGPISWLGAVVRQLVKQRADRRRIQLCVDDLRGLDDRMLADIGIGRSEIEYLVSHGREAGHRRMS